MLKKKKWCKKILWYSSFFGVLLLNTKVCIFILKAIKYMDVTGIMSYMPTFRARKQIFQFQAEVWCCYFGKKKLSFTDFYSSILVTCMKM